MSVRLALYKGKGQIGNAAIRWWTGSIYSHCELVIDGMCYSSSLMDGGVRKKQIELHNGKWDLVPLPWVNAAGVLQYFAETDHHRYGWPSLIASQLFNRNRATASAQFCSEWCANAIRMPNPGIYSPHTLGDVCGFVGALGYPTGFLIRCQPLQTAQ